MANTNGPATGTAEFFFGQTAAVEVQVPAGLPSLEPSRAPNVDAGQAGTNYAGSPVVPINKTVTFGSTGATVVIANPA